MIFMALPVLKLGSKGDNVKRLQKVLGIVADGNFGYGTRTAAMNFQKANGLVADGVVGNLTWANYTRENHLYYNGYIKPAELAQNGDRACVGGG